MASLAVLVYFLLAAAPSFGKDFWNIDCGGNSTSKSANGFVLEDDGEYIHTGKRVQVTNAARNNLTAVFSTLRAFPKERWAKSCYRIPVEQGTKVLVRTQFYYGNYDGMDSPPEFDVRFDTSGSCSVTTSSNLSTWQFCEVVYQTTKEQGTDVCFVPTQGDPIVSTIEVRRLRDDMYDLLNFAENWVFMRQRFAFGANATIEDPYSRLWHPELLKGVDGVDNDPIIVERQSLTAPNTSRISDSPPKLLFQKAVMAPMVDNTTAGNITIRTPWLSSDASYLYFTMYYAEVELQSMNRTFEVFLDGKSISENLTLKVETGVAHEFYASMYQATNESKFDLVPTKRSSLPPIISGMEVFLIFDVEAGTDSKDVEALSVLQSNFTTLQNWTGDPCHPNGSSWEWVSCNYSASPLRVTKLQLNGFQLTGVLPDFSGLDALQVIILSNNTLTGPVPEFLSSLPNLQTLDLSDNDFDSIPASLANKEGLTLITNGNNKLERQSASSPGQQPIPPPPAGGCPKLISSRLDLFLLLLAIVTTA